MSTTISRRTVLRGVGVTMCLPFLESLGFRAFAKAAPAIRARHFLLLPGANEIAIEYSKTDPKASDRLEITLEAEGYPKPLLQLVNREKASDKLNVSVQIQKTAPAGFKPVLIGETK